MSSRRSPTSGHDGHSQEVVGSSAPHVPHEPDTELASDAQDGVAFETKLAALFSAALLAVTLAPIAQNWAEAPADGFPFSYYPMFSHPVGETYRVTHVVGLDADGREHVIPYGYLGTGGLNEVRVYVERAAHQHPKQFCEEVAARLSARPSDDLRHVRELVVRTGAYVMESFYAGAIQARSQREHVKCRVPR
jgi:hypothetical protein